MPDKTTEPLTAASVTAFKNLFSTRKIRETLSLIRDLRPLVHIVTAPTRGTDTVQRVR